MYRNLAVVKGKTVIYSELSDGWEYLLLKDNYRYMTVSAETFNSLFERLTDTLAALREDCIEYVIYSPYTPLLAYPKWYIDEHHDFGGSLYEHSFGTTYFYEESGELLMSPGSVVLRNKLGDVRYMERETFFKYYEIPGGVEDHD